MTDCFENDFSIQDGAQRHEGLIENNLLHALHARFRAEPGSSWQPPSRRELSARPIPATQLLRPPLRTWNLGGYDGNIYAMEPGQTIQWRGMVENRRAPWYVVVIPDNDITQRIELNGSANH